MDDIAEFIKKYWLTGIIAVLLLGMSVYVFSLNYKANQYQAEYITLTDTLTTLTAELAKVSEVYDAEKEKNTIRENSVSATDISESMIAVDTVLTSFYRSSMPFPEGISADERAALIQKGEDAKAKYRTITGLDPANGVNTWQLNPEWSLKLETILTYKSVKEIPVLFSMKTKDGRDAGLVQTTYDVESNTLKNIVTHYTQAGIEDKADVGGQ